MSIENDPHDSSSTRETVSFVYEAQTIGGEAVTGTIAAHDLDDANRRLAGLGLRVVAISATTSPKPRALRGDDFAAFNQQLAQLAGAGLPLEQGLRLIAQDMRSGRLSRTVSLVAEELERGVPLGEAFGKYQTSFPPLYGQLMDAGIRTGNLPAMLLNLGRYAELVQRLRGALWRRQISYPLMVLVGLVFVLLFLSYFVLPKFEQIFKDFKTELPGITKLVLGIGHTLPTMLIVFAVLVFLWFIVLPLLRNRGNAFEESILLSIPLVGPVVRRGLLARWCDAVKLAVDAGLDLPAAVGMASRSIDSERLRQDGQRLVEWLAAAPTANVPPTGLCVIPATVAATMALATREDQLSRSLGTLAQMYAQQVEQRTVAIPAVLGPFLLIVVTVAIGFVMMGVLAPMISLIRSVSGG